MAKKDILDPSPTETRKTFESVWEATEAERLERERRGLTLEPEVKYVPRDIHEKGTKPIEKKEGLGLGDYIRKWQEANSGYVLENINTNRVEIANMTDAEIPFEFVDYLIGKANDSVETLDIHLFGEARQISGADDLIKSKDIHLLGEIKQIKIKFNKKTKMLIVMVRDAKNTISFYFESEPPFNLKHMDSHLGIYTF